MTKRKQTHASYSWTWKTQTQHPLNWAWNHAAMLEVLLLRTNKFEELHAEISKFLRQLCSMAMYFEWRVIPHTTVCKQTLNLPRYAAAA